MKLFLLQSKAELTRVLRNHYFIFWSLVMPIIFYFIFTRLVNHDIPNASEWQAYYLMSMAAFSVMGSAIMTLGTRLVFEKSNGWSAYMRITPLSSQTYFFAKMSGQLFIHILSIIVIFIAGFLINGVALHPWQWLTSGLWLIVGSIPFLALGTLIGCIKKVDTANGFSNLLYLLLAIIGGMWMPIDQMPTIVKLVAEWLPSYHYGSGAWGIIRGELPEWHNIVILTGYLCLFMILSSYIQKRQDAI